MNVRYTTLISLLLWKCNRSSAATWTLVQLRFTCTKSPYLSSTRSLQVSGTHLHEDDQFPRLDLTKIGYLRNTYSTPPKVKKKRKCMNKFRSLRGKHNKRMKKQNSYSTTWMHYQDKLWKMWQHFLGRKRLGKKF